MIKQSASQAENSPAQDNPLELLAEQLDSDMDAVNEMILQHTASPVSLIPQVASYLINAGGKRIRPLLTLACTNIFTGDMNRAYGLAASVEFIHTATLLHDDVVDESDQRRGQDAANLVYGNQASVLVGDFLFSRAFQLMVADGSLDVLKTLSDAAAIIAQGEVMQLMTANNLETDISQYIEVIRAKTAALFAAACEVGPLIGEADRHAVAAMAEYGLNLGIAFQIADDALDYSADREKLGKTIGDDFREGKITAPVIYAYQAAGEDGKKFWQRTVAQKDQTPEDLQKAQELIEKHGAIQHSLDLAASYGEKARLALTEAPDHPLRALLDKLVSYTIYRSA